MIAAQRHLGPPFGIGMGGHAHRHVGEVPVGTVIAFAGQVAPPQPATASPPDSATEVDGAGIHAEALGWMLCDGRLLRCGEYHELFHVLGALYGGNSADGTFQLPDYRGYFLRGTDAGAGHDPDVAVRTPPPGGSAGQVGSSQRDALLTHYHEYEYEAVPAPVDPAGAGKAASTQAEPFFSKAPVDASHKPLAPANGGSDHETRPSNVYVNYLIKFTNWPMHAAFGQP